MIPLFKTLIGGSTLIICNFNNDHNIIETYQVKKIM